MTDKHNIMAIFGLTLVRHGETHCNRESITQGQSDTELSEQGIQQAKLLGHRLQYEKFTHVFSSDLQRALKTCEIILKENKVCPTPIKQDKRLRERKFGVFEGQPSTNLVKAARKARSNISSFTPEGGESSQEVHLRAKGFFDDLCQSLHQLVLDRDNNCLEVPASGGGIKRRRNTSSSTVDQVFPESSPPIDNSSVGPSSSSAASQHTNSGSTTSSSGCWSGGSGDSPPSTSSSHLPPPPSHYAPTPPQPHPQHPPPPRRDLQHNCLPPPSPSQPIPGVEGSEGKSSAARLAAPASAPEDEDLDACEGVTYGSCPNVSLSPLFEHRPSTMSSVSSGRNSSFDDGDMIPLPLADILIVTHGGVLRELIRYFVNTLGCQIPGGKGYMKNVSPNTGISRFTVTLGDSESDPPRLTCLTIHDRDHLQGKYSAPHAQQAFSIHALDHEEVAL